MTKNKVKAEHRIDDLNLGRVNGYYYNNSSVQYRKMIQYGDDYEFQEQRDLFNELLLESVGSDSN